MCISFFFYLQSKFVIVLFYKFLNMIFSYSDHEENFISLYVYLHNFGRTKPYSYTNIKIDVMGCFQLCFVAIVCMTK